MPRETIVKTKGRDDPFARVPKDLLNDPALSWRAKGICAYLIGKPDGWKVRILDIQKHGREGRDAVRAALNELRNNGYASLVKIREKGKYAEMVWKVSDAKIFDPLPENPPLPEKPETVLPKTDNQRLNKIDDSNEIKNNKRPDGPSLEEEEDISEQFARLRQSLAGEYSPPQQPLRESNEFQSEGQLEEEYEW